MKPCTIAGTWLILAACTGPTGHVEQVDLAITRVDVLDVRTGERQGERTVLIDEGRIVAIEDSATKPRANRVLDGRGGLLLPGFIDAHSHLAYVLGDSLSTGGGLITRLSSDPDSAAAYRREHASQYLPYGVTTVRDVGSSEADLPLLVGWMRDPLHDAPDVFPSGGALVSYEEGRETFPGHRVVRDSGEAVAAIREYHAMGLRHAKLYWRLREPEFSAALAEARRLEMTPTAHVDFKVLDMPRALDLGLRSFEHAYTLGVSALSPEDFTAAWREHLPRWIGDRTEGRFYLGVMEYFSMLGPDDPRMAELIERLASTDTVIVPTLHLFAQRFGLAPVESRKLGEFDDLSGLTAEQLEHARRGYGILAEYVRRLHEAGVPLAVGSDWIDPGQAVLSEMWLLHRAGIPMKDVLRIGTRGGAEALGIEDSAGLVAEGRRANLVLLAGDPFTDPGALLGPRTVIKDGVLVAENTEGVAEITAEDSAGSSAAISAPPRLAVLIAVDQLGEKLLGRFAPHLPGGLGRLTREGRWFLEARVDHAVTVSHPGHVTLSTGLDPADHGIVDAAFYEGVPGNRRFVDAVADSSEHLLGGGPGVSPRQIRAPGLWDWIAGPSARRVAIGTGRVSSLLYARSAGDVYWFDRGRPGYVTSSFYRSRMPDWVESFNARDLPRLMTDTAWVFSAPDSLRHLARRDSAAYETRGLHPTFPHRFHDEVDAEHHSDPRAVASWFSNTPMLDGASLALARAAVRQSQLGADDVTDLLVIVLSQVDNIGHWYGPRSLEQLDNLWRLDAELGRFLDFLDDEIGGDRYVVALSADHGAPAAPEYRRERGESAQRVRAEQVDAASRAARDAAGAAGADPQVRAQAVADALERIPWIAEAMTPADLLGTGPGEAFVDLYRRSSSSSRMPRYPVFSFETGLSTVAEEGVVVRLAPDAMLDLDVSVHGSPYDYDRHVPVIFYGPGVAPGCTRLRVATRDVAPTLAALAGVPTPPGVREHSLETGRPASSSHTECPRQ